MGEIADAIINGEICALCCAPFISEKGKRQIKRGSHTPEGYEHGYPVACEECWEDDCGYQKATASTINELNEC